MDTEHQCQSLLCKKKVFLSWSGDRSKALAKILREWLPLVIQSASPWISTDDITAGSRWSKNVARELDLTSFGILCVTPENLKAPWLLFESGALSKSLEKSHVCPFLMDVECSNLPGPIAQYQAVNATHDGTLHMLRSLNSTLGNLALSAKHLSLTFEKWWPMLSDKIDEITNTPQPPILPAFLPLGFVGVYPTRASALEYFVPFLVKELSDATEKDPARFWVTASSIQGLLTAPGCKGFHEGQELIKLITDSHCDIRIMLTDPKAAESRAEQEGRAAGKIEREVKENLLRLKHNGIDQKQVRYYPGTPTVFAIAIKKTMLLNPYPYEAQAFSAFSLIVRNTSEEDIYDQYITPHFESPWGKAKVIPRKDWNG